ncbi:MAG: cyclophilin family peptidyl-prolyl cis-trans isomerase [Candidatus Latescibacterota bacterium]|jgi:cyclophilin family peptidyl-prolyl cis-trans isomerase
MVKKIGTLFLLSLITVLPAKAQSDLGEGMYAQMQTNKGLILLKLFYDKTPRTVANFVGLAEGSKEWRNPDTQELKKSKFYDGLKFHRVLKDFMIQGGDPLGTGSGGPGYKFRDEFHPQLKHNKPGILSMANSGPNTNGSQFFITHVATPWLNKKHSVFGEVEQGMNVVNNIAQGDIILSLKILRVGAKAESFDVATLEKNAEIGAQKLAQKNKKEVPTLTGKADPSRIPQPGQVADENVAVDLMVIAYKGSQTPKENIYYDKAGALEIAQALVEVARQEGVDFAEINSQFTDFPQQTSLPVLQQSDPKLPPFLKSALHLKVGQISDPIDSPMGFLILRRKEGP